MNPITPTDSINPLNYLIAGIIALVVAIADEFHQAYLPARNASIIDIFLDIIGIILCVAIIHELESKSRLSNIMMLMSRITKKRDQL
jgi:VanZ family protein